MSRAVITHFDGDPFFLNFWLKLYRNYWRGEVESVYLALAANPETVPPNVLNFDLELLKEYPEIKVTHINHKEYPELTNQALLKIAKEPFVALIESDGFIFGKGIVDNCFRKLSEFDIVASEWDLIADPYVRGDLGIKGFMRCFFFAKKNWLDSIDVDFMPKNLPSGFELPNNNHMLECDLNLDCFGWISLQLATMKPKVLWVPCNVINPTTAFKTSVYSNYPWVHIRQMTSSALGISSDEFALWQEPNEALIENIFKQYHAEFADGPAEFIYSKAVATRLLFLEYFDKGTTIDSFTVDYRNTLELIIDLYNLPRNYIYELKGFFRGLMALD